MTVLALLPLLAAGAGCASTASDDDEGAAETRTALVYRGPASCEGCAETLAERLAGPPLNLDVQFIGPDEDLPLDASALEGAALYVQPGGEDDVLAAAATFPEPFVEALHDHVADGGAYIGVCMGAYLAGADGFGLLDESVDTMVGVEGFPVTDSGDHLVDVTWEDEQRATFFQDGAQLPAENAEAFAYYETGDIAAATYAVGRGDVALIGPHPEADDSWLGEELTDPDGDDWSHALPLVEALLDGRPE